MHVGGGVVHVYVCTLFSPPGSGDTSFSDLSTQNDAKDSAGLVPRTVLAQNRSWVNLLKESVKEPKNQLTSGPDNLDSNLGLITQQRWTEEMWMLSLNYKVTDASSSATLSSVLEVSTTSRFWLDLSDGASEYPLLKT